MYCKDGSNKSEFNRDAYWQCIDKSRTYSIHQLASTRFETTPLNDILMKFFNLNEKIKGEETRGQKNLSEYILNTIKKLVIKITIELTLFLFIICHRTGHLV